MTDAADMIHAIRGKRKGILSAAAFFITVSVFIIANVLLMSNLKIRTLTSENLIADRVYHVYESINHATVELVEEVLGNTSTALLMRIDIDEDTDFSYVTFTEGFPQDTSAFRTELSKLENFVEGFLNETNIFVETTISDIGNTMSVEVEPYDLNYTHPPTWGDGSSREFSVTPDSTSQSLDNLNGYDVVIRLFDNWNVTPGSASWSTAAGDLRVNITAFSDAAGPTYSSIQYLSRSQESTFDIDTNRTDGGVQTGWIEIRVSSNADGDLLFDMGNSIASVETRLNLTETEWKTKANFVEGKINVVEELYNIEKNHTVTMV